MELLHLIAAGSVMLGGAYLIGYLILSAAMPRLRERNIARRREG